MVVGGAIQAVKGSNGSVGTTCNVTRHAAKAVNGSLDELEFDLDWCAGSPLLLLHLTAWQPFPASLGGLVLSHTGAAP